MKKLLLLPLMFMFFGCTTVNLIHPGEDVFIDVRVHKAQIAPSIEHKDLEIMGFWLKIYEFSDMPGIVNEIYLSNGTRLVEYFDTPGGAFKMGQYDRHSTIGLKGSNKRYIYTYPAKVEGLDATASGFGELPENKTGSVKSTTNPENFNVGYHANHKRQGKVIEDMRDNGRWWSVYYDSRAGKMVFQLDDKPHFAESNSKE